MKQEIPRDSPGYGLAIDFEAITQLFNTADEQGRNALFEHETYDLLSKSGAETPPRTKVLAKGSRPADEELIAMPGDQVVLKVISPTIIHKTEVGGVKVVEKKAEKIRSAWRRMMYEVPENYAARIEKDPAHGPEKYRGLSGEQLQQAIARDIRGVLMVQFMPPDSQAFGNELIVGIRNTREFGMVISAGLGGTDTELYAERFRKGQAIVAASTAATDGQAFFALFQKTICYKKLAGLTRGQRRVVTNEQIIECFSSIIALANCYSPLNPHAPYVIEELEINPFAFTDYLMVPLDGMCRFTKPGNIPATRPYQKIGTLLHPRTIGLIGVSPTRVNFGRVILNNILA
ncbi:MAG TPA: acetate--CoA ligase family protein, partial [Desulforhopalus sp.]|nr:acetate--CoA ligase family protein [Desulforhopalus sp.]